MWSKLMGVHKFFYILGFICLAGCASSSLTYSNFVKVKPGMSEREVIDLLGEPHKVTSVNIDTGIGSILGLGDLAGTNMIWTTPEAKANVIFLKGKVRNYNFTNQF